MQNVSLQTAVKMTGKSESTIRRDVKKGKVSARRDERGHLQFDVAELQRAYGELKTTGEDAQSTEQGNGKAMTGHDSAEIIALLESQVADLQKQLTRGNERENKLITLSDRLQKQNEVLMLTGEKRGWFMRLITGN